MKKYEAMFIINPDLNENTRKELFAKIEEVIKKNNGEVKSGDVWSEKRKLYFPIKKFREGIYYLVNFNVAPSDIAAMNHEYKLNEDILRVLITNKEEWRG